MEQTSQMRLQQVNLAASVGAHYLLQNISFEVFQGDRIVLVGPSGAGKTSLLRLLNRLSEPTQGAIYLDNQEIRQIPVIQLRRQIVLVPQESKLLGMTVEAALTYPLTLQELPRTTVAQRLQYWLEQLHIPSEWLDRTELQLSVGQRQLVAIARALMLQPKILLLDEPTSALDAGRAAHVLKVLTDLAESGQTTLLMVNHQLDLAQEFCTRVLYLQQGQLLKDSHCPAIDWIDLRNTLIQVETETAQEWM
ncbi:ATP-binding cassette domain-containing protein [Trichocoleus sp. FACHB-591]|uniref:ABC transporter ATP-binding protein n=1 Tax=Trichocoleus sp. FACHB-591 TaxID=2692872 RepID=UPI001684063F|nr:ATP-binding cassette domain-containing protein [Trichocoleus sp. FACHB-591]MBD2096661.1 ATP-binding cassette domain-containing protein [Trichocoleus sp. FACHB-591]